MSAAVQPKPRPFIVREIPAPMLRRNVELSKGARHLWLTMRSMADERTGALRHKDHWYSGVEIDYRAEISTRKRKDLMKELVAAGLASWHRESVERTIKDRLTGHLRSRRVLGPTHYRVSKSPHKHSRSSTVQSLHGAINAPTNLLSEIHHGRACDVLTGSAAGVESKRGNCKSSSPSLDDLKKSFLSKCVDPDGVIEAMLEVIVSRAEKSGVRINSEKYFHVATANFDLETPGSQDREDWRTVRMLMGFHRTVE